MAAELEVLSNFSDNGALAFVTLNRASRLNALNLGMVRLLHGVVDEVDKRSGQLACLVLGGAGGKAFCAGGDVAAIQAEAMAGGSLPADFFFEEYALIFRLATLFERTGVCTVSFWDGYVMGGGVGISAHADIRIATEKTVFAMPEMSIGLFPDVGMTQLLGRLPIGRAVGVYLGATGVKLNACDVLESGLATHFVPSASLPRLRELLAGIRAGTTGAAALVACEEAIHKVASGPTHDAKIRDVLTASNVEVIDRCFGAASLEEIVTRLSAEPGGFAAATLRTMKKSCSPTSCKVTIRAIGENSADGVSLGGCLQKAYRLSQRFTTRPQPQSDFWEGIRAVLVDKDRKQRWAPGWDELGRVDGEALDLFFAPLEPGHRRGELVLEHAAAWNESERPPFPALVLKAKL